MYVCKHAFMYWTWCIDFNVILYSTNSFQLFSFKEISQSKFHLHILSHISEVHVQLIISYLILPSQKYGVCVYIYLEIPCYRLLMVSRIHDIIIIFLPNSYPQYVVSYIKDIIEVSPPRFPNRESHFIFFLTAAFSDSSYILSVPVVLSFLFSTSVVFQDLCFSADCFILKAALLVKIQGNI